MKLSLTFWQRICLLFLLLVLGLSLSFGVQNLLRQLTDNAVAATRIAVVAQNLLAFILPALLLALLITRLPADFLMIRQLPSARKFGCAILGLCVVLPAAEMLDRLCRLLPWSDAVLQMEAQASAAVALVAGPHTLLNLQITILIVGVITGLGEEMFFRGAMQQTLRTRPMNMHLAVWLTALVFALMHAQPVGTLPRMVLGAYFGYVSLWSGSLWTAITCHAINNTIAIILLYTH